MAKLAADVRAQMLKDINAEAAERTALEAKHGEVWDIDEFRRDFSMDGPFAAPTCMVKRRADGVDDVSVKATMFVQELCPFCLLDFVDQIDRLCFAVVRHLLGINELVF